MRKWLRMVRFGLVGVANTGVDVALFTLLTHGFHWLVPLANVVSYSAGIMNSFFLNKYWTFRDATPLSRSLRPGFRFVVVNLLGLLISTLTVMLLALRFPPVIAKLVSVGVVFIWNYSLSNRFVFSPTAE
jgi:putative flippase GtrA